MLTAIHMHVWNSGKNSMVINVRRWHELSDSKGHFDDFALHWDQPPSIFILHHQLIALVFDIIDFHSKVLPHHPFRFPLFTIQIHITHVVPLTRIIRKLQDKHITIDMLLKKRVLQKAVARMQDEEYMVSGRADHSTLAPGFTGPEFLLAHVRLPADQSLDKIRLSVQERVCFG